MVETKKEPVIGERFSRVSEKQALLGILALATVLRFIGANSGLWFDEIISVRHHFRVPLAEIVSVYSSANNHVMNSVLAHISLNLLGEQAWVVRLPSILFGVAGVWAFYFLGVKLWKQNIALAGTFLFSISYPHIYYTQNARGYSAFLFFSLLASGLALRMVDNERQGKTWPLGAGYAASLGLGLYAHLLMNFIILGHGLTFLFGGKRRELAWLVGGVSLGLVLYFPMWGDLLAYYTEHPTKTGFPLFSKGFIREITPVLPLLLLGPIILATPLVRLWRRYPLAVALIILPLILNIFLPVLRGQGVHPRFFIYALVVGYIIFIEGVDWAKGRFPRMAWGAVSVVIIVSVFPMFKYYSLPKQGFQQALEYIEINREPGDSVIGLTLGGKAARYYDKSVKLVNNMEQLRNELDNGYKRVWVLFTFKKYLRGGAPKLNEWVEQETVSKAVFPGVIGNGEVSVHLWTPAKAP